MVLKKTRPLTYTKDTKDTETKHTQQKPPDNNTNDRHPYRNSNDKQTVEMTPVDIVQDY